MAFQTGATTGPVDLLGKIVTAVLTQGWVINHNAIMSTDPDKWNVSMQALIDGTIRYWNWQARDDTLEMSIVGSTGYSGAAAEDGLAQPGAALMWADTNYLATPMKRYWFFYGAEYFHVVVEITTGYYAHFGVGYLDKCNTYPGGEYVYNTYTDVNSVNLPDGVRNQYPFDSVTYELLSASLHPGHVRAEGDSAPDGWYYFTGDNDVVFDDRKAAGQARIYALSNYLVQRSGPIRYSGQGALFPHLVYLKYEITGYWGYAGMPQDIRVCNIEGFTPGGTFILGPDTWWTFPVRHNGGAGINTGNYGIAFRQV